MEEELNMSHKTIRKYCDALQSIVVKNDVGFDLTNVKGFIIDNPIDKETKRRIELFNRIVANNEANKQPLSRECLIYKRYRENNFAEVKNLPKFMKSIENGLVGIKPIKAKVDNMEIIL